MMGGRCLAQTRWLDDGSRWCGVAGSMMGANDVGSMGAVVGLMMGANDVGSMAMVGGNGDACDDG